LEEETDEMEEEINEVEALEDELYCGVKSAIMLSGLGFLPFITKSNLMSLRMGQVMRSLVVLSVPLTMLCDGWLRHQRFGRQGYSFEEYHHSGGCSV
jgi:hypothetical protein